ncbi:MAG: FecR domain-containing protein [Candidatus Ozemobacteraceae bacterium]
MSIQEREAQLHDLLEGSMDAAERRELESHLDVCPECRQALAQARLGETFIKSVSIKPNPDIVDRIMEKIRSAPPLLQKSPPQTSPFDRIRGEAPRSGGGYHRWHEFFGSLRRFLHTFTGADTGNGIGMGWAFGLGMLIAAVVGFLFMSSSGKAPSSYRFDAPPQTASTQENQAILGILCHAEGDWSCPTLSLPGSFTSDTSFKTGSDGKLELSLNGTGRIIVTPDTMLTLRRDQVCFERGVIWCEIEKRGRLSPFVISADGNRIEVVGTRFGIRKSQKGIEAFLVEGTLRLSSMTGEPRILRAGEQAIFSDNGIGIHLFTDEDRALWVRFFGNHCRSTRLEVPSVRPSPIPAPATSSSAITPSPAPLAVASSPALSALSSAATSGIASPTVTCPVPPPDSPNLFQMLDEHQPASTP